MIWDSNNVTYTFVVNILWMWHMVFIKTEGQHWGKASSLGWTLGTIDHKVTKKSSHICLQIGIVETLSHIAEIEPYTLSPLGWGNG